MPLDMKKLIAKNEVLSDDDTEPESSSDESNSSEQMVSSDSDEFNISIADI